MGEAGGKPHSQAPSPSKSRGTMHGSASLKAKRQGVGGLHHLQAPCPPLRKSPAAPLSSLQDGHSGTQRRLWEGRPCSPSYPPLQLAPFSARGGGTWGG